MDATNYVPGMIATGLSGACAIAVAVIGFFIRDKLTELRLLHDLYGKIATRCTELEAAKERSDERVAELEGTVDELRESGTRLDKELAVERARDESLELLRAILGKLDVLLTRTPSRGLPVVKT